MTRNSSTEVGKTLSERDKALILKRHALHCKYEKAVAIYADTDMPMKDIAKECGVTVGGLGSYLRRYWRELVLRRHQIHADGKKAEDIKIMEAGKQSIHAHAKYKDAVAACDSLNYIDLNVSQVARKFGTDGTALANFMRIHYPETLVWREKVRRRLGINDNIWHGARPECTKQYAEAVEMYRDTEMTMMEVAAACNVSPSGFSQHLRFYHKEILEQKKQIRETAKAKRQQVLGELTGNGRVYRPSPATKQRYAQALELYRNTALTMKEIVRRTGVPAEGFRFYLHKWHKDLVIERLGISSNVSGHTDLRKARKRMKTVAAKYEEAIKSLRMTPRPVAEVAAEFGLHPEVFRDYLHKHEPELARQQGMMKTANGKIVSRRSEEKYAEAVRLYGTTTETLKSIAARLGLTYNSVGGYIRRNYPEVMALHQNLLKTQSAN